MRTQASLALILISLLLLIPLGHACKDLVAIGDATAGDYSLLLKVRDPSRPGPQVLVKIPTGYTYTYHHPWTGLPLPFTVTHAFIGVCSQNDTPPNITKAGMALTDAGIAYGDADTGSRWTNPTPTAWDDFDWLRYAYQTATTTSDATHLLTTATTNLHATSVSENLFLVGPHTATLIEADAIHTHTTPITTTLASSNYPTSLWPTQLLNTRPIATSYNTTTHTQARTGQTIRLGSLCGIQLTKITDTTITVRPIPRLYFHFANITTPTTLTINQTVLIGPYRLTLNTITNHTADLRLAYKYYDWETLLLTQMNTRYGHLTLEDFMNLSRLHTTDLQGLRPLCEDTYPDEAAMIFQIPTHNASLLSSAWFAANHACSSIYIPTHVSDTTIDTNYTTPAAANLSHHLLQLYGHGTLTQPFHQTEQAFIAQNKLAEFIASLLPIDNATRLLTLSDTASQHQAILTEKLWETLATLTTTPDYPVLQTHLAHLWGTTLGETLDNINTTITYTTPELTSTLGQLSLSIVNTTLQIDAYRGVTIPTPTLTLYTQGVIAIQDGNITKGTTILEQVFHQLETLD